MSPPISSSRPKDEAEVIRILAACFELGVPVTPRGSGTGNYGQAMPLAGGVILNLAEMNKVKAIGRGRVVAEAGAVLAEIDRQTRTTSQQEIRLHPSTYNTASLAGFVAGGSAASARSTGGASATSATCCRSASSPWRRRRACSN